jgi:hypothetical protein
LKVSKNVEALDSAVSNHDLGDLIRELGHGVLLRDMLVDHDGVRVRVWNRVVLEQKVGGLVDVFAVETKTRNFPNFELASRSEPGRSSREKIVERFLKQIQ